MRLVCFGDDEQARCVLVDSVDYAGTSHAANAGALPLAMVQKRVHQRTVGIASRGMDHKTRRLVDDDQMLVLLGYGQRNHLWSCHRLRGGRDRDFNLFGLPYLEIDRALWRERA